jgi:hypothetical protein
LASGTGNVQGYYAGDPFLRVWDVTDPREVKDCTFRHFLSNLIADLH